MKKQLTIKATDIQLLGTFRDATCDLVFEAESENGTLYDVRIDVGEIAQYLKYDNKKINLIDGSDDVMEAARQMYEGWSEREATYSIEVKRQEKLIFKRSAAKAN
jgi:hypothetical protein